MNSFGGGDIVLQFLTSRLDGSEWAASRLGRFTLKKGVPDADWAPEPICMLWRREKFLVSARDRTQAVHPVTIQTELSDTSPSIANTCIYAKFNPFRVQSLLRILPPEDAFLLLGLFWLSKEMLITWPTPQPTDVCNIALCVFWERETQSLYKRITGI
jgi:hypothetical protein